MALIKRRGKSWYVQWKELVVLRQPDGSDKRVWKTRGRSAPTKAAARQLVQDIDIAHSLGERWSQPREEATVTLHNVALAYVRAAVDVGAPISTQRFRSAMIGSFLDFVGDDEPVTSLSLTLLERYAATLPSEGRKAVTRHRKVMEVELMWRWAHDRPELFPGVPIPRRYTGSLAEADKLRAPPPVVAMAAPTWADVDAMIDCLKIPWHKRVATIMRFTGLRASQGCGLHWQDFDLDRGVLRVRSHVRGAKRGRSRVIPLHSTLIADMATWGVREGLLFPRRYKKPDGSSRTGPYRGDALTAPFRRAWTLAEVPLDRWDVPNYVIDDFSARAKGSPTHAIRRCVRTELLRAGVEEALVLYLIGQSQGITAAAYVPESSPEQSPYWPRLVEAVEKIPAVGKVMRLPAQAQS